MGKLVIENVIDLAEYIGQELGTSNLFTITQDHVDQFANATSDHQWIHKDTERTRMQSPFKAPIAHGYFTVALIPHLWEEIVTVNDMQYIINYEIERLRFSSPVIVGNDVRLYASLISIKNLRGINKIRIQVNLKIESNAASVFTGIIVFLYGSKVVS